MGYFGSYISLSVDTEDAKKQVIKELRRVLKVGIKAWVEEVKSVVPVWSGGERAALTQIAAYADVPVFGPGSHSEVANTEPRGVDNQAARQAKGRGSETFTINEGEIANGKLSFRWTSSLPYFNVNERTDTRKFGFNLINPGPYNLRRRGKAAFKAAVTKELKSFKFNLRRALRLRRFDIG